MSIELFTKPGSTVDYKEATDILFKRVTAASLAEALGVSANAIARARLDSTTRDFRPAPASWAKAVALLAEERANELLKLKADLDNAD